MTSLARRVALALLGGQVILLGAGTWVAYRAGERALTKQFDDALIQRATTLASSLEQQGRQVGIDLDPEFMPEYFASEEPDYFQLFVGEYVLARSPGLEDNDLTLRFGSLEQPQTWDESLPDGRAGRAVGLVTPVSEVEPDPETGELVDAAEVTLVVATGRDALDRLAGFLLAGLLGGAAALLLGGLAIILVAVKLSLGPVHRLATRVKELDADTLAVPLETRGVPRELHPVVAGLNDLLARLDQALRAERRTASNVAHELKTPISELRSLTEVALQDPDDHLFRDRALVQAHEVALQMDSLVDMIRQLTHVDAQAEALPAAEIPVRGLVDDLLPLVRRRALEKGLELDVSVNGEVLECNPCAVRTVCGNLLANAVEYSAAGGRVEVQALPLGDRVAIRITNACLDLEPEHLPFLTEPFWRRSTARTTGEHYGLGLTIAHGFAKLAGIQLELRVQDGRFVADAIVPRRPAA